MMINSSFQIFVTGVGKLPLYRRQMVIRVIKWKEKREMVNRIQK